MSEVHMFYRSLLFAASLVGLVAGPVANSAETDHPIVIVHGAWGGSHHWKAVANELTQKHGHIVRRVSLTGLGPKQHLATPDVGLDTHIQDVVNAIEFDDLQDVIVIAHSYGGVVASGVAHKIPARLAHVYYLDSHLLEDGECYLTHHADAREQLTKRAAEAGDGWLIPVDWPNHVRDVPHPLATLTQAVKLDHPDGASVAASYWLFADGRPAEQDSRHRYLERAKTRGYTTRVLDWNHNPQRERPTDVATAIDKAIDTLQH